MPEKLPRTLIVDASILFSFFKKDSARRRIIEELPNLGCRLISPEFALKELLFDKEKIMKYGKINELSFAFLFSLLLRKIDPISEEKYKEFLSEANKISPHGEKIKDDPYFALALAFNCDIWSDESAFKQQSKVKVFNTKELLELLGFS
ncbi:MAG: hypothetical protein DRP10_02385 [Candidatus Aenigmatarchaeota archaeon]|nr:MAG: hypothetical protein DRP10_02385 [Candidatus Aenigmarchaeota archaeon]